MQIKAVTAALVSVAAVLVLFFFPAMVAGDYWPSVVINIIINVLLACSLRTISLIGHISLGHVGFMAMGGYCSAVLVMKAGFPFAAAFFCAGLLPTVVALAIGYPFLRVKGVYFAILTLLTGQIIRLVAYSWSGLTGGQLGLTGIPPIDDLKLPGIGTIAFDNTRAYYYLYSIILVIGLIVLYLLERSELGKRWIAIEGNDVLAESIGINVLQYKILIFALGCFFAGIAGSMYAHFWGVLGADTGGTFGLINGMFVVLYMFVGGKKKFYGPIVGTIVVLVLAEFCRPLKEYQPMITAALGLMVVFVMPDGLVSLPGRFLQWCRTARGPRDLAHAEREDVTTQEPEVKEV